MPTVSLPKILANFSTSLASKMSASATSFTLSRSTDDDGTTFSGTYELTFDEGTSLEEHMIVTLTGSAGTVVRRGLSRVDGWTEVAGNKNEHDRGASVKCTTFSLLHLVRLLSGTDAFNSVDLSGINSITGLATPTSAETTKAANVAYVNAVSIAGASDASEIGKGIVEMGTAAQATNGTATGETGAPLVLTPARIATQIQSGSWISGTTAGTASAITATLTPTLTAYSHNMIIALHTSNANDAGCTLNIDGLGARAVYKYAGGSAIAVEAGDMGANYHHIFLYDSDSNVFLLVNPVNGSLTSAIQTLVQNNIVDLTDGGSTTIHTHNSLVPSFSHFVAVNTADTSATSMDQVNAGFSDASTAIISAGVQIAGAVDDIYQLAIKVSDDIGLSTYADAYYRYDTSASPVTNGAIVIGTSVWQLTADATSGNRVRKDGGSVTISGTNPGAVGALGHDPTNSYLLALDSTTTIKRYSGIAGTTITFVDSITLDTAVSTVGFAYDADNQRYICLDKTANILRRFNSTGTTIDTVAYTVDDANVLGVCIIGNRVYLIAINRQTITGGTTGFGANISLVPTNMTR